MEKYKVTINGKVYEVEVEKMEGTIIPSAAPAPAPAPSGASGDTLKAPIQGTVLKINVKPGQSVSAGEVMCVIEAMKLENDIVSDRDGVIGEVFVREKDTVDNGQELISFRG